MLCGCKSFSSTCAGASLYFLPQIDRFWDSVASVCSGNSVICIRDENRIFGWKENKRNSVFFSFFLERGERKRPGFSGWHLYRFYMFKLKQIENSPCSYIQAANRSICSPTLRYHLFLSCSFFLWASFYIGHPCCNSGNDLNGKIMGKLQKATTSLCSIMIF